MLSHCLHDYLLLVFGWPSRLALVLLDPIHLSGFALWQLVVYLAVLPCMIDQICSKHWTSSQRQQYTRFDNIHSHTLIIQDWSKRRFILTNCPHRECRVWPTKCAKVSKHSVYKLLPWLILVFFITDTCELKGPAGFAENFGQASSRNSRDSSMQEIIDRWKAL